MLRREVVVRSPEGLHVRAAAAVVRLTGGFDAEATVGGAATTSLLALLALGLGPGSRTELTASGRQAAVLLDQLAELFESGFDELPHATGEADDRHNEAPPR